MRRKMEIISKKKKRQEIFHHVKVSGTYHIPLATSLLPFEHVFCISVEKNLRLEVAEEALCFINEQPDEKWNGFTLVIVYVLNGIVLEVELAVSVHVCVFVWNNCAMDAKWECVCVLRMARQKRETRFLETEFRLEGRLYINGCVSHNVFSPSSSHPGPILWCASTRKMKLLLTKFYSNPFNVLIIAIQINGFRMNEQKRKVCHIKTAFYLQLEHRETPFFSDHFAKIDVLTVFLALLSKTSEINSLKLLGKWRERVENMLQIFSLALHTKWIYNKIGCIIRMVNDVNLFCDLKLNIWQAKKKLAAADDGDRWLRPYWWWQSSKMA